MSDGDDTSIRIKVETWKQLKNRKDHPNMSFDDVIRELLENADGDGSGNPKMMAAD